MTQSDMGIVPRLRTALQNALRLDPTELLSFYANIGTYVGYHRNSVYALQNIQANTLIFISVGSVINSNGRLENWPHPKADRIHFPIRRQDRLLRYSWFSTEIKKFFESLRLMDDFEAGLEFKSGMRSLTATFVRNQHDRIVERLDEIRSYITKLSDLKSSESNLRCDAEQIREKISSLQGLSNTFKNKYVERSEVLRNIFHSL